MPKLDYFLVAESISTDKDRNTLSIFHIVEEAYGRLPFVVTNLAGVASWTIAAEEMGRDFQVLLKIYQSEKRELPSFAPFSLNFTADRERYRTCHYVNGLRIEEPGDLVFEILLNGEHVADRIVHIRPTEDGD